MSSTNILLSIKRRFLYSLTALSLCISTFFSIATQAQTIPDSVYISGKVLNLTGRLFREAPAVTFSRNNILVPTVEMVRNAPIQADGSFKVALPLLFKQEEVYLSYGGKVFTTFLASPGDIEIVFNADSIFKAQRLFYFAGQNAEANNQYTTYLAEENKILKQNKKYGDDFQKNFWNAGMSITAYKLAEERIRLKRSALEVASRNVVPSEVLQQWVYSSTKDEQAALLLGHVLSLNGDAEKSVIEDLSSVTKAPLTLQRIEWLLVIKNYLNRSIERSKRDGKQKTLRVTKIAELSAKYVSPLSAEEKQLLQRIISMGSGTKSEVESLAKIFDRGPGILTILMEYEVRKQAYTGEFKPEVEEYMNAIYFAENSDLLLAEEKKIVYEHINKDIVEPVIKNALAEIYQLSTKTDEKVNTALNKHLTSTDPEEIERDIWVTEAAQDGAIWLAKLREQLPQKPLYVSLWQLGDPASMEEMTFANELRMNTSEKVQFVYIHVVKTDNKRQRDLWKQYIVKHDIKGIHLYLTLNQSYQLASLLNTYDIPSYALVRANGKVPSYTPPPSNGVETVRFIEKTIAR